MPDYGSYEKFPFTNFHGLNLDWILQEMKKLEEMYDHGIDQKIIERIHEIILVDAYDADTETLTLTLVLPEEE